MSVRVVKLRTIPHRTVLFPNSTGTTPENRKRRFTAADEMMFHRRVPLLGSSVRHPWLSRKSGFIRGKYAPSETKRNHQVIRCESDPSVKIELEEIDEGDPDTQERPPFQDVP